MGGGSDSPAPDPASVALRNSQIAQLAQVDDQDNYTRKKILNASRGTRFFTGAPITRAAPSNAAPKPVTPIVPSKASFGGAGYGGIVGGLRLGGLL